MTNNESRGHAVVAGASGRHDGVEDPFVELFKPQRPSPRFAAFQRQPLEEQAEPLGL